MSKKEKKIDRTAIKSRLRSLDSQMGLVNTGNTSEQVVREVRHIVRESRKAIEYCPCCDQSITDKEISFHKQAIRGMYEVYMWLGVEERNEFETNEIKHLLDKSTYANIGHWKKFGGIFYRPDDEDTGDPRKGLWGMNMGRAKDFFTGKRTAPTQLIKDRFTGEIVASTEKFIHEFPNLQDFLTENGLFDTHHVVDDSNAAKKDRPTVPQHKKND